MKPSLGRFFFAPKITQRCPGNHGTPKSSRYKRPLWKVWNREVKIPSPKPCARSCQICPWHRSQIELTLPKTARSKPPKRAKRQQFKRSVNPWQHFARSVKPRCTNPPKTKKEIWHAKIDRHKKEWFSITRSDKESCARTRASFCSMQINFTQCTNSRARRHLIAQNARLNINP